MALDRLLASLNGVRGTGLSKWLARCPAHDDRRPSLSIRELEDGRVLLHCWSGCETDSVLAAIGLDFSDLFPEPIAGHAPRVRRAFSAADALLAIDFETTIVQIAACALAAGKPIDQDRLRVAAQRIGKAMDAVRG